MPKPRNSIASYPLDRLELGADLVAKMPWWSRITTNILAAIKAPSILELDAFPF